MSKNTTRAPIPVGSIHQVQIEKMAVGGSALARMNGAVVFVPRGAPGDVLEIRILESKKNFLRGEIVKIITPSPSRREAPCPYFENCGGCSWQHLNQETQEEQKKNILLETLKQFLPDFEIPWDGFVKSPLSLRYRNRIQPQVVDGRLGYFNHNSHNLVEIDDCLIAEEPLSKLIPELKQKVSKENIISARFELFIDDSGKPQFIDMADPQNKEKVRGFAQVNALINLELQKTIVAWSLDEIFPHRIVDLYAGSGNLTFPLSEAHKKIPVIGVELHPLLARRGRQQLLAKKIPPKSCEFFEADVGHFLRRFPLHKTDLVVLDPPRAGLDPFVVQSLVAAKVENILYVSCHPVSLGRDLRLFSEEAKRRGCHFSISRVKAFDMFPQTDHLEALVQLKIDSSLHSDSLEG